ncbi:hypothetical protein ACHAL6_01235 [Proteiniclasticum sp. C24MP]|uniref:hypothetical protein n=1 Tax=Proteiniclasticum sp. C24MP TaxID=3374101 RepID=UPI003754B5BD
MVNGVKQMLLGVGLSGLAISLLVVSIGTDSSAYFFSGFILEIIAFFILLNGYSMKD